MQRKVCNDDWGGNGYENRVLRDDRVYIINASLVLACGVMAMFALYQAARKYVRCSRWVVRFRAPDLEHESLGR